MEEIQKKINEKLMSEYHFDNIVPVDFKCFNVGHSCIQEFINNDYKNLCDEYGIDMLKLLEDSNIPEKIHAKDIIYYFLAKKNNDNVLAKIELNGLVEFGMNEKISIIQRFDHYSSGYQSIDLLDNNQLSRYLFYGANPGIYKNTVLGKIVYSDYAEINDPFKSVGNIISFLNNDLYCNSFKIYSDKKIIKDVREINTNEGKVSDFVDIITDYVFLISFEDNTYRLLIMKAINGSKRPTQYFSKLDYRSSFIKKKGTYGDPVPGLTFDYETGNESGEYLVVKNGESYYCRKRYIK